jgi:hypothetical protein
MAASKLDRIQGRVRRDRDKEHDASEHNQPSQPLWREP